MRILQIVLADLIRRGQVIIDVPNLDLDELRKAVQTDAVYLLQQIEAIVCEEEMTAEEKVEWIQEQLKD